MIDEIDGPCAVEPRFGYVVRGRLGVIEASLPYSEYARSDTSRVYFSGVPTVAQLSVRRRHRHATGMLLNIRHPFDTNYFHGVVECVGSIAEYERAGMLDANTLVLSQAFSSTPLWRGLELAGATAGLRLVVQDDEWIDGSMGAAFVHAGMTPDRLTITRRFVDARLSRAENVGEPVRLFVTRRADVGRTVRNGEELSDVVEAFGFVAVDPGSLTWAEQVETFRRASCVVGVHGAGLTNILFRSPSDMRVLEIQVEGGGNQLYREMAGHLGYKYECILGSNSDNKGNRPTFDVDCDAVASALERLCGRP